MVLLEYQKERRIINMKQRKRKKISNETKFIIVLNIIIIGYFIFKIATNGINFLSTIGYFG